MNNGEGEGAAFLYHLVVSSNNIQHLLLTYTDAASSLSIFCDNFFTLLEIIVAPGHNKYKYFLSCIASLGHLK